VESSVILFIIGLIFVVLFYFFLGRGQSNEEEELKTPYEIVSYAVKKNYLDSLDVLGTTIQNLGFSRGVLYYGAIYKGEIFRIWSYDYKYKKPIKRKIKKKVAGTEIEEEIEDFEEEVIPFIALEVLQEKDIRELNRTEGIIEKFFKFLFGGRKREIMGEIYILRRDLISLTPNFFTRELIVVIPSNFELINYNGVWVINDAKNRLHPEAVSERIKLNEISAQLTLLPVKMSFLNENIASSMAIMEKQKEMLEFQKQLREEGIKKEL